MIKIIYAKTAEEAGVKGADVITELLKSYNSIKIGFEFSK